MIWKNSVLQRPNGMFKCAVNIVYGHLSGDLFVLNVMIYLLSLHEIMFYFLFVHNYILILDI
jgi:hypothetical protein